MRALTIAPGQAQSARVEEVPEPARTYGDVLVDTLAIGICGTDREMVAGHYGTAPPGEGRLILGHESLGRVREAPPGCGLSPGDLVAGIVRRPDPVPCPSCEVGEWDMCRNGRYTERGIKALHGFCSERFRIEPEFAVKVDSALELLGVLVEPASVIAKAWEHINFIGLRTRWAPRRALVTGAGPIGLLASLFCVQNGLDVHVLDRVETGIKPDLVKALGATYHTTDVREACQRADVVIECTGVGQLVVDAMLCTAPGGVVCLTGISSGGREIRLDAGLLNRSIVLENDVIFGSVNANRRHYEAAAEMLAGADRSWLGQLITERVPLAKWSDVLEHDPVRSVKSVIDFTV